MVVSAVAAGEDGGVPFKEAFVENVEKLFLNHVLLLLLGLLLLLLHFANVKLIVEVLFFGLPLGSLFNGRLNQLLT